MTLGQQLRDIRKRKSITQKELAKQVGISANAMCNIEKGYSLPSIGTMNAICEVLKVEFKLIEK